MHTSHFNRRRFAALLRLDWSEKRNTYLAFLAGTYIITAIILTGIHINLYTETLPIKEMLDQREGLLPDMDRGWKYNVQVLVTAFFMFMLFSTSIFRTRTQLHGECRRTMLLPATAFEKFMRWWLHAVPFSLVAFTAIYGAADLTRILICRTVFPGIGLAYPLYRDPDLWTSPLQLIFTLTLFGQTIIAVTATLKSAYSRIIGRFSILILPFVLIYGIENLMRTYPSDTETAVAYAAGWHLSLITLTVVGWYVAFRRFPLIDLEYCYPAKYDHA